MSSPLITIVVPSFNQRAFLEDALASLLQQNVPLEIFVMDGGSTDGSVDVVRAWQHCLAGWRSHADAGQAAAINEGIARGKAPYVGWLNSDDWLLPGGLERLMVALERHPEAPAAYGRAWNVAYPSGRRTAAWVQPFSQRRLAVRCIVSQPATLVRRTAWEAVGGVDPSLHMVMDYDLWWRLYKRFGDLHYLDDVVAVNREHAGTKTSSLRKRHYQEAIAVVRKHHGSVPMKWWVAQPYAVWYRSLKALIRE